MPNFLQTKKEGDVVEIKGSVDWRYGHDKSTDKWIAVCKPFKITLQADSLHDLQQDMREAIDELFTDLMESGELNDFLRAHGWATQNPLPRRRPKSRVVFDVPQRTMRMRRRDLQAVLC